MNKLDALSLRRPSPWVVIAICASVLSLGACDRRPTAAPAPLADTPVAADAGSRAGAGGDPSVPSTESAFPTASARKADPTVVVSDGERNPAQESKGLPMPGQNNDHSAPLDTAKRAGSP